MTYDNDWATADNNIGVLQDWAQFDLRPMSPNHIHPFNYSNRAGGNPGLSHFPGGNHQNGDPNHSFPINTFGNPSRNFFSWPAGIHWAITTFPRNFAAVPFLKVR